jgi:hypothetical protein
MFPPWRLPNLTPDIIHINVLAVTRAKWCGHSPVTDLDGQHSVGRQDLMAADGQAHSRRKPIVTGVPIGAPESGRAPSAKPTAAGLGVDLAALDWQRSGDGPGSFEVAFVASSRDLRSDKPGGRLGQDARADWVLLRVAGDLNGRVLVYDRNEWTCFLDGAGHGEFDWPQALRRVSLA